MSDRASASAERLKQRRLELQTRSQKNVSDFKDRTSAATKRISAADAKRKESSDADKDKQKKAADAHRERIAKKYSDIRARRQEAAERKQKEAERKQMKDEIKSELSKKETDDKSNSSKKETDVSEADDYNQRDKELKKTSNARKQRFKDLHTATNTDSNEDVNEGRVARAVRDTIDKLPQGRPGGKRDKIRQAAVNAEIRDKKSKEKGTTTYQQWSDAVNAAKKRNKS